MSIRMHDEHTLYVESGVATEAQVSGCLKAAIEKADTVLGYQTKCKFKVNLIVGNDGKYFGFGYIRVSDSKIYWMLLGRNPDGSERFEEYLDPDWTPPEITVKTQNKWIDIVEEEDALIHPKIRKELPPLVNIPGYEYDEEQIEHLKELEDAQEIPQTGYFEISRAYATEPDKNMIKNRICSRKVPDWIPVEAFKAIFSTYTSPESRKKEASIKFGNKIIKDTYPIVNFVESKNGGRIVFITFSPNTNDALFALLMTKKTRIVNPANKDQKTTLIFMHAYDNKR